MSEVTTVWLLAVALDGEDNFWLCEPTNLKPLAADWKSCNCRWLYPVVENVSRFSDLDGFESTDAVYEVEWSGVSKVLRAATLTWNVRCKRQKVGRTTYVFVPAEEMRLLDEAYSKFAKLEAMKPPPPRGSLGTSSSYAEARRQRQAYAAGAAEGWTEYEGDEVRENPPTGSLSAVDAFFKPEEEYGNNNVKASQQLGEGSQAASVTSSSVARHGSARASRYRSSSYAAGSHKRQAPHKGTTTYQAPVHSKPMGDHRSDEAFDWPEMFVVHRGSVDYLCPRQTNNSYGFRLDRVLHDGFPVFLLFGSKNNNSESIDSYARGVPVFEKAKLSGEGGEGSIRNSVLVLTRLSSKKHQPYYRKNTGRRVRRHGDSDEDSITSEDEEEEDYLGDESDAEDGDDDDDDLYPNDDDNDKPLLLPQERLTKVKPRLTPPPQRKAKTEPLLATEETDVSSRKRGRKGAADKAEAPLQAVSVNFWTDPQGMAPAVSQLAKEFPFRSEGADAPQTAVFNDGVCVTYTAATAAKHVPSQEKKRKATKPGHASASTEDADLSMLNEHILNAFAQVRKEST